MLTCSSRCNAVARFGRVVPWRALVWFLLYCAIYGGVLAIDRKTGGLTLLNYRESKGRGPSYVSGDKSGRYVLDANYGGGYIELNQDGSVKQVNYPS